MPTNIKIFPSEKICLCPATQLVISLTMHTSFKLHLGQESFFIPSYKPKLKADNSDTETHILYVFFAVVKTPKYLCYKNVHKQST